jgi:CHAT domain-containing protein
MSSEYSIVRLSSTRELTNKQPKKRPSSASLFGGINYDVDIEKLIMLSESNSFEKMIATRSLIKETELRGRATYLQGTRNEVEEIFAILNPHLSSIAKHSADSATEESFKALSGAHLNIIHVATHGFYWPDTVAHNERYFKQRSAISDLTTQLEEIDPMDRCGLLFAGANTALSGHSNRIPEGVQDGILTAKEISSMDLRDANIVVLSACETGLGDISGEGVFGLQRAFKMAGAQSLLMSLWKVNDKATQMLMTAFYRYYSKGRTKREALRLAQQEVRESGYMNPYYWAGFIMLD